MCPSLAFRAARSGAEIVSRSRGLDRPCAPTPLGASFWKEWKAQSARKPHRQLVPSVLLVSSSFPLRPFFPFFCV